jgi:hypothetical protein
MLILTGIIIAIISTILYREHRSNRQRAIVPAAQPQNPDGDLTDRTSVAELERDQKTYGPSNAKWQALKSEMIHGDELWYYCTSPESWQQLHGRAGIALVRRGQVVDRLVVLMN